VASIAQTLKELTSQIFVYVHCGILYRKGENCRKLM